LHQLSVDKFIHLIYSVDAEQCEPRSTFSELEAAVRRLTPAEVALRRAHLGSGSLFSYDDGCRTPDSIMSTGSSGAFSGNSNSMNWKLPDKLQVSSHHICYFLQF
jgi:hypothetical protein